MLTPDPVCLVGLAMQAGDGKDMFAHAGIVASATAILKDLEDRGLLEVGAGQ